jgi:hypothetical protein
MAGLRQFDQHVGFDLTPRIGSPAQICSVYRAAALNRGSVMWPTTRAARRHHDRSHDHLIREL